MDKCWFVLKQTHYPPPTYVTLPTGEEQQRGWICIGHLLESPKTLDDDNPLNGGDPPPYPLDMLISTSKPMNVKWSHSAERGYEVSGNIDAPVAEAIGITVGADLNLALQNTVKNDWVIDALKVTIARPTQGYVRSSAASVKAPTTVSGKEMYMITGLIIAQGHKSGTTASGSETTAGGGLKL